MYLKLTEALLREIIERLLDEQRNNVIAFYTDEETERKILEDMQREMKKMHIDLHHSN